MVKTIQTMIRLTIRFALLLLFSTPASAQLQQGLISGTVLDPMVIRLRMPTFRRR